jgi:predicted protein tyrosine phosphatase
MTDHTGVRLRICGIDEALDKRKNWANHTVSLIDTSKQWDSFPQMEDHTLIRADDLWKVSQLQEGERLFNHDDMIEIEKVVQKIRSHPGATFNLLVHCHGGISRSPAVAAGILWMLSGNAKWACSEVHRVRPIAWMNEWILHTIDESQSANGDFFWIAIDAREANASPYRRNLAGRQHV